MELFASLEDLISFDIITECAKEVLMEKETNEGYDLRERSERNPCL